MRDKSIFAACLPLLAMATLCCASFALRADDATKPAPAAEPKKPDAPKKDEAKTAAPDKKEEAKDAAPEKKEQKDLKDPKDDLSETTNTVIIDGAEVKYKA